LILIVENVPDSYFF